MRNVIFIGGIHGVGKGTLCKKVCADLGLRHLIASEVLKWNEISDKQNKLVQDFSLTQNRLINNLKQVIKDEDKYILDGHYCLLNSNQIPERINPETFKLLDPFAFIIVIDDVKEIIFRLEQRDKIKYDYELLLKFQEIELKYYKELASHLSKPHIVLGKNEVQKLKTFIHNENFA